MQKFGTHRPQHVGRFMGILSATLAPLLTSETQNRALMITCFDREVWCRGNTTDICTQGAWFEARLAILPGIYRESTYLSISLYEVWNFNFGNTPLDWIQELLEWRANAAGRMGPSPLPTYIMGGVHHEMGIRSSQLIVSRCRDSV